MKNVDKLLQALILLREFVEEEFSDTSKAVEEPALEASIELAVEEDKPDRGCPKEFLLNDLPADEEPAEVEPKIDDTFREPNREVDTPAPEVPAQSVKSPEKMNFKELREFYKALAKEKQNGKKNV